MSFITSLHPVPDVSGVVESICTFCDASGEVSDGDLWYLKENESLDIDYLAAVLRGILKVWLSPLAKFICSRQIGAIAVSINSEGGKRFLRNWISTVDFLPQTVQTRGCNLVRWCAKGRTRRAQHGSLF